jgi:hypothetical protein
MITREHIKKAIHFPEFLLLNQSLLLEGKTTGLTQTEEYVEFGRLNVARMQRLMKTVVLKGELNDVLSRLSIPHTLIVITEGWCGDSAQIVPVLEHIRLACPYLDVVFLMRDENPQLMDQFLTKGARSIPKVVCEEQTSVEVKMEWGQLPFELQAALNALIAQQVTHAEKSLFVQNWYNQNKTQAIQSEIMRLVQTLL